MLTARKAVDAVDRERRKKRGGGAVGGGLAGEAVIGPEPTPSFAAALAEECDVLLGRLGDDELRRIAVWKLEGYTNREIAGKLAKSLATVERKLDLIRRKWDPPRPGG